MADTVSNAVTKNNSQDIVSSVNDSNEYPILAQETLSVGFWHPQSLPGQQQQQANTSQLNTTSSTTQDNVTDIQLENCHKLNDNEMDQYMHLFDRNNAHNGIFQNCTFNNPVFHITIKKVTQVIFRY